MRPDHAAVYATHHDHVICTDNNIMNRIILVIPAAPAMDISYPLACNPPPLIIVGLPLYILILLQPF